jgi:transcriptional regulator with XRE-family HTH domain
MNATEIGKQLQKFLADNKISQETVADATNTNQTQVSRIKNGDFKRITENVKRICEYANIDLNVTKEKVNPAQNLDLMAAISEVWDGTDKKAKALAKVILSLKGLSPSV